MPSNSMPRAPVRTPHRGSAEELPRPRVSVVLPTYGRSDMLALAIATVAQQSFRDWELLVIDDNGRGSEEQRRSEAVVRARASDPRVRYVARERNGGAGASRNEGIALARGEFVAFLDDDDVWYPTKLSAQVACFDASPSDVALVYGAYRRATVGLAPKLFQPVPARRVRARLLSHNVIGTTSLVLCRRSALIDVGGFDEQLPARQDVDLYFRLAGRYPFAVAEGVLVDKVEHAGDTITKNADSVLRGHAMFYSKHRGAFLDDRNAHHAFLYSYGEKALRAGRFADARGLLRRAWTLRPKAVRALVLATVAFRPWMPWYQRARRSMAARDHVAHGSRALVSGKATLH